MPLTDRDDIRVAEIDEELIAFDVSDIALERAANIIGGVASPVTVLFPPCGTAFSQCPS
jgi:hypothetical protein